jgi:hypothetical protein
MRFFSAKPSPDSRLKATTSRIRPAHMTRAARSGLTDALHHLPVLLSLMLASWLHAQAISPDEIARLLEGEHIAFQQAALLSHNQLQSQLDPDDIHLRNGAGLTPFLMACAFNADTNAIDYLLRLGSDAKARSTATEDALILAARFNESPAVADYLVHAGFDINVRSLESGKTPLMQAANYNSNAMVARLIELGASVHMRPTAGLYKGETPLMFACKFYAKGELDKVKTLLRAGSDINAVNEKGENVLIVAAQSELFNHDILEYLLAQGADQEHRDAAGKRAADYIELSYNQELFGLSTDPESKTSAPDEDTLRWAARRHGWLAGILSILLFAGSFFPVRNLKPTSRAGHAGKMALYPLPVLLAFLGGPLARSINGIESRFLPSFEGVLLGLIGIYILIGPFVFILAWLLAGKRFRT